MDDHQPPRPSETVHHAANEEEEKPVRCARFRQQELWAWKPVWTPFIIAIMYLIVSVIFLPIGVVLFVQSNNLVATPKFRYDDVAGCNIGNESSLTTAPTCTVSFTIDEDVASGAFFYYGILNFYQNARTYVSSRSDAQLRGDSNPGTDTCEDVEFNPDNSSEVLVPCGLIAASRFNDSFRLCSDAACNQPLSLNGSNISWDIDRNTRFRPSDTRTAAENALITSEDFMVWMRLSAYQDWKKLYRRIESPMAKGTYFVEITSRYPVEGFNGEKFFFISETSWFGGRNREMGVAYIAVGGVALALAIVIFIGGRTVGNVDLPAETGILLDGFVAEKELPQPQPQQQQQQQQQQGSANASA